MRLHLLFTSNIILAILAYFQLSKNEVYTHSTSDVYTMEFVKVAGTEFLLNNKIWKPVGFNTYILIEQAAELPYGSFNAIYSDLDGNLYDPFNGKKDLENGVIKFIGDPEKRIRERS